MFTKRGLRLSLLSVILTALLVGCNDHHNGSANTSNANKDNDNGSHIEREPTTILEAIEIAEDNGDYPRLNHDTTIAGPDDDVNGVRDDIDTYIVSLPDSDHKKTALRQLSRAITHVMVADTSDENILVVATRKINMAISCIYDRYTKSSDTSAAHAAVSAIRKFTVNTPERFSAYETFNMNASGHSFVMPQGDVYDEG